MSANLEAKKQVVEDIKAKINESKSVVLVDYKGLTVAEDTTLRNEFRKANVQYKVLKNTLVRKAFNDLGITSFDADLNGTTAVAFGADETAASKVVIDNAKKFNDKISVKTGKIFFTDLDFSFGIAYPFKKRFLIILSIKSYFMLLCVIIRKSKKEVV